jgi:hypothetical protein
VAPIDDGMNVGILADTTRSRRLDGKHWNNDAIVRSAMVTQEVVKSIPQKKKRGREISRKRKLHHFFLPNANLFPGICGRSRKQPGK